MRTLSLLATLLIGCPGGAGDGNIVTGDLSGEGFDAATLVFDEYGAAPDDSAAPEQQQLMLVLADEPEVCPLLGPLFHYKWLRCESTCAGLLEHQDLWPSDTLRVLWVEITVDEQLEGLYELSNAGGPGLFSADYRPVDLSVLEGMDQEACYTACTEDFGFLLTEQGSASLGELELDGLDDDVLEGELDVLFSAGDVQAIFDAPRCEMGLHGP
jgi:hypothetical protein